MSAPSTATLQINLEVVITPGFLEISPYETRRLITTLLRNALAEEITDQHTGLKIKATDIATATVFQGGLHSETFEVK